MYKAEYKDKIFTGETEKELFFKLRKERLSLRKIGQLSGKAGSWVGLILGNVGKLEFPELDDPTTFLDSDEMIAYNLNLPVSRVSAARRRLGLKSKFKTNVDQRRREFSKFLFGYEPGPNFVDWLKEQIQNLSEGKGRVLEDFYILGQSQSLADNVNGDSDRVYRHLARKELKKWVQQFNIKELIEERVIDGK